MKRCDWKNANAYPASHDTNATMWAWEFLRRNRDYQTSFDNWSAYQSEKPRPKVADLERYQHMLEVGWNVYDLLPPDQSYAELVRREPERMADFAFSGQEPAVYYPQFNAEEIVRRSRGSTFLDSVFVGAAATTAYLAVNEVMVRICLD
ncbi:MAG: transcriptional regulator domain-containing protein, partial [Casimicrobium sp.]